MNSDSVSVVIPAYNAASYVVDALNSVLGQTMQPTELLIVDDGSSDRTIEVVNAWRDAHRPAFDVQLVPQQNAGAPSARNTGIRRASQEWVALLDADDVWETGHIATLVDAVNSAPDVVAAYGAGRLLVDGVTQQRPYDDFWDSPSRRFGVPVSKGSAYLRIDFRAFARLAKGNFIKPSSLMFSRQAALSVGLFNVALRSAEDREFLVRLLRVGDFVYTPEPITQYRWHDDNLSHGRHARRNSENSLRALKLIAGNTQLALSPAERAACDAAIAEAATGYLYLSVREGWVTYRQALLFLAENFNRRLALRSWRPKHLLKLIVRA